MRDIGMGLAKDRLAISTLAIAVFDVHICVATKFAGFLVETRCIPKY